MNRKKYLFKNTILFAVSTLSARLIGFLMVPIFTYVLTKEQFGTIDIIMTSISLVAPILALNVHNAVLRFTLDRNADHSLVFSYGVLVTVAGIFILFFLYPLLKNIALLSEYAVPIYCLYSLYCLYFLVSEFMRGLERINEFVLGNVLLVVITALSNIVTLFFLKMGIRGYIISSCIGYTTAVAYFIIVGKEYKYLTVKVFNKNNAEVLMNMVEYSVFLIPNALFWWITNASDRYFVFILLGASYNGIYAIANKIPALLTSVSGIFIEAWQLSAIKEYGSSDKNEYYNYIFKRLFGAVLLFSSGILTVLKIFLSIYVSKEYFVAWQSSTFLILSAAFGMVASFLGINYVAAKKNFGNMLSTLVGASFNIVLNIVLIPRFELMGASVATFISYLAVVIYRIIDTKKYVQIKVINMQNFLTFGIILLQIGLLFVTNESFCLPVVILLLVAILINKYLIKEIYQTVTSKINKYHIKG